MPPEPRLDRVARKMKMLRCLVAAIAFCVAAGSSRTRVSRVFGGVGTSLSSQPGSLYGVIGYTGSAVSAACFNGDCPQNGPCPPSTSSMPSNLIFSSNAVAGPTLPAAGAGFTSGLCCCGSGNLLCVGEGIGGAWQPLQSLMRRLRCFCARVYSHSRFPCSLFRANALFSSLFLTAAASTGTTIKR